jgi:hypothetical protein
LKSPFSNNVVELIILSAVFAIIDIMTSWQEEGLQHQKKDIDLSVSDIQVVLILLRLIEEGNLWTNENRKVYVLYAKWLRIALHEIDGTCHHS